MGKQLFLPNANPRIMLLSDNLRGSDFPLHALEQGGYRIDVFSSVEDAFSVFSLDAFDMVLWDESFPFVETIEGISRFKQALDGRIVPIIMLLKQHDSDQLSGYINAGADDFLASPFRADMLLAKVRLCNQVRLMHSTLQHQRDQIRLHNDHLLQEQQVAKRIYDNITSSGCLTAKNIRYFMSPMAMFNGDILVAAMRPSGNMLILLGDFTGHGLPAAIGAIPLSSAFYGMVHKGFEPEDILREINQKVKAALPVGFFCCACMVEINFHEQTVLVWNGGMPDVFLLRLQTGVEKIPSAHLALGILDNRQFDARFQRYSMQLGERLYLWTDGIIEATDDNDDMFGEDRLARVFDHAVSSDDLMRDVCVAVSDFMGDSSSSDDVSIVEISMVSPDQLHVEEKQTIAQTTQTAPTDWSMHFEITPSAVRVGSPIPMMLNVLMEVPGLRQHSSSIYTILTELYSNALEHGILRLDSAVKKSANGFVEYYAERDRRLADVQGGNLRFELQHRVEGDGGVLQIRVHDSGEGFDYGKRNASGNAFSGRGVDLVRQLCQSLDFCGRGNEVQAVYRWGNFH